LNHTILSQRGPNHENESGEDIAVDNHLEEIHFAELVRDAMSGTGSCASRQFGVGRNDV